YPLPEDLISSMLKYTERMSAYLPSMYHDHAEQRPMELEAIYKAPLRAAKEVGCAMPKISMLLQTLEYLSAQ
ncbi:MAG TPA: ketopantoate reductase C-terminal domain-containing protein, partial [Thiopseudomonas sp.]|nr:ketopantoate reductase C-terminal domain-containing protein [Thiopseudomonas sp.]